MRVQDRRVCRVGMTEVDDEFCSETFSSEVRFNGCEPLGMNPPMPLPPLSSLAEVDVEAQAVDRRRIGLQPQIPLTLPLREFELVGVIGVGWEEPAEEGARDEHAERELLWNRQVRRDGLLLIREAGWVEDESRGVSDSASESVDGAVEVG